MITERRKNLLKSIWFVVNITTAIGTFVSAYGGKIDPAVTPIPAILAMTFPFWLVAGIALLVINLLIPGFRRQALIPGITLLVCAAPISTFAPLHIPHHKVTDNDSDNSFTLLCYNTLGLRDISRDTISFDKDTYTRKIAEGARNPTASYIISTDADLVCLQEFRALTPSGPYYFTQEQVDTIKNRYPHIAALNGEDILSRYPLQQVTMRQPDSKYALFGAAIVNIQGHETLVVSVHMQSIGLNDDDKALYTDLIKGDVEGRSQMGRVKRQLLGKLSFAFKERAKQARMLRQQIDSIGIENVIVAGDFNDIPGCFALRELCRDDFHSAFAEAGCGPEVTYHANRFYFHIDHILYRGAMRAVAYERGSCPNSDHYPIMARFIWEKDSDSNNEQQLTNLNN